MSYSKADHEAFLLRKQQELEQQKNTPKTSTKSAKLSFANDGSFLARFQEMQRKEAEGKASSSSEFPTTSINLNKNDKLSITPAKQKTSKPKFELKNSASIFTKAEITEVNVQSDYDVAKELAQKVVKEGNQAEAEARIQCCNDSRYRFLFDPLSDVAKLYQAELKNTSDSNNHNKRRWDQSSSSSSSGTQVLPSLSSTQGLPSSQSLSSSTTTTADPLSEFEKAKALVRAKAAALMGGATAVVSEEDKKRQKDIEEQRLMQDIYRKVIEQQVTAAQTSTKKKKKSNKDKPQYTYDSDEDTEGGTWEHKKRVEEMEKTREWAIDLTSSAKGKHHLADFLPADELEMFFEKVKAVKEGREVDFSDYSKYRIQDDNLGYKMLQKAGWEEGTGLGAKGEGIKEPVNKGKLSFDQAGVGAEKPAQVKKEDDDFDLYRKRMMLSYKFRPNPLNNPRRPYY